MKVIVAGATGFIGRALVADLYRQSHEVVALSRSAEKARGVLGSAIEVVEWNPGQAGPWMDVFSGADGVVNLTGEVVADPFKPWTASYKERIRSSRVGPTRAIVDALRQASPRPRVLVNQSAIGYYGSQGNTVLNEDSPVGSDFLAGVVRDWEAAAQPAEELEVRLVLLRTGIVFGQGGQFLQQLSIPFKLFAGGTMGDRGQWISWIHLDDETGIISYALEHEEVRGPINAVAPEPVTMDVLSRQIGRALNRPTWVPMVGLAMRLGLGRRAQAVLASERAMPKRLQELGYQFLHPDSDEAVRSVLVG